MPEFDKAAVRYFLQEFKSLMREDEFFVINRKENYCSLIKLGITKKNRDDELKTLTVLDYVSGPDPDLTHPGTVWVFGKNILSHEVYIKLKIVARDYGNKAICLSFHPSEEPLHYPFRAE